jgi:hypothetical protein
VVCLCSSRRRVCIGSDVLCDKEQEDAQGRGVVVTLEEGGVKAMCEKANRGVILKRLLKVKY